MLAASDPIAALATPRGESALAVIRASGAGSIRLLAPLFRGRADLSRVPTHTLHHGILGTDARPVDEVVLAVYRAPRSYTGEEAVEIYCHGGPAVVRSLLELLRGAGFRPAGPGEFTLRAFLNGRMDLTRAEAVNEVIRARTDRARALALDRLAGGIERRIDEAKNRLTDAKAAVEVRLDYPDDYPDTAPAAAEAEMAAVEASLRELLASYRTGRLVQQGVVAAIAGRPNAGKSTLFNLLLREERAIVSETPGTTRDYIEGTLDVAGVPVRLLDTAGLRPPRDDVEAQGIRRTEQILRDAALVLYVVDAATGLQAEDRAALASLGERALPLWNKVDLAPGPHPDGFTRVSALAARGIGELTAEIARRLEAGSSADSSEAVLDSERQKERVEAALAALERAREAARGPAADVVAFELDDALRSLGEITGEVTSEAVLRRMFARFCVGK